MARAVPGQNFRKDSRVFYIDPLCSQMSVPKSPDMYGPMRP